MDSLESLCISDHVKCKQTRLFQLKVKIVRQVENKSKLGYLGETCLKQKDIKDGESKDGT